MKRRLATLLIRCARRLEPAQPRVNIRYDSAARVAEAERNFERARRQHAMRGLQ